MTGFTEYVIIVIVQYITYEGVMVSKSSVIEYLSGFNQDMVGRYPISELLANHIKDLIATGRLAPGTEVPGVRELSAAVPISYVNIQKALAQCSKEGLLSRCPGRKTIVSTVAASVLKKCVYLVMQHTGEEFHMRGWGVDEYFSLMISGIQSELAKHGSLVMAMMVADSVQEELLLSKLSLSPPDLVLISRSKNTALLSGIQKKSVPVILIEPHVYDNEELPIIMHDHERQSADLVNRLTAAGCRSAAVIFRDEDKWIANDRLETLLTRLRVGKISVPDQWVKFIKQSLPSTEIERSVSSVFSSAKKPDAVIISGFFDEAIRVIESAGLCRKPFIAAYFAERLRPGADYTISLDPRNFGVSVGKLVVNNFLRDSRAIVPKKYFVL